MLTPKCPPRDFRVGSGLLFAKTRLCRQSGAMREGKLAGNRPKKEGSAKHVFSFNINDLGWLCWEAAANLSRQSISLITGKIQGNFPDLAAKAGRRLGFPTVSQLVTPKFPTHPNRQFCGANRELFPAEQGKSLAKSPAKFSERTAGPAAMKIRFGGLILFVPEGIAGKAAIAG